MPLEHRLKQNDSTIYSRYVRDLSSNLFPMRLGSERALVTNTLAVVKDPWVDAQSLSRDPGGVFTCFRAAVLTPQARTDCAFQNDDDSDSSKLSITQCVTTLSQQPTGRIDRGTRSTGCISNLADIFVFQSNTCQL